MATKPTVVPRWATDPADPGDLVEPTEDLKDAGWLPGQKPAAQVLNWMLNKGGEWAEYLDEFLDDPHTWNALQTFTGRAYGAINHATNAVFEALQSGAGAAFKGTNGAGGPAFHGVANTGVAFKGTSASGRAVEGISTTGPGVYGEGGQYGLYGLGKAGTNAPGLVGQGDGTGPGGKSYRGAGTPIAHEMHGQVDFSGDVVPATTYDYGVAGFGRGLVPRGWAKAYVDGSVGSAQNILTVTTGVGYIGVKFNLPVPGLNDFASFIMLSSLVAPKIFTADSVDGGKALVNIYMRELDGVTPHAGTGYASVFLFSNV